MNVPEKYQTFWPRFWAGWVDALVFLPLWPLDSLLHSATTSPYLLAVWFVLSTLAFDLYNVVMHARYGQTLGKMLAGVRVVDLSGGKLSLRQAFIRDCVPVALTVLSITSGLPLVLAGVDPYTSGQFSWLDQLQIYASSMWFAAELITMLTNSKRRAIHDYLASSVVVRLSAHERESSGDAAAA
jgi:uncharacterized RDD family membrane protein YckC